MAKNLSSRGKKRYEPSSNVNGLPLRPRGPYRRFVCGEGHRISLSFSRYIIYIIFSVVADQELKLLITPCVTLGSMMETLKVVTSEEMARVEKGLSGHERLMQEAGRQVALVVMEH